MLHLPRDVQIPRDKRPNVSCFHKDTAYRFELFAEDEENLSRMGRNNRDKNYGNAWHIFISTNLD